MLHRTLESSLVTEMELACGYPEPLLLIPDGEDEQGDHSELQVRKKWLALSSIGLLYGQQNISNESSLQSQIVNKRVDPHWDVIKFFVS